MTTRILAAKIVASKVWLAWEIFFFAASVAVLLFSVLK